VVTTLAGSGTAGLVNGQGTGAQFNRPIGLVLDRDGFLYVVENSNNTVRKITPDGQVTTFCREWVPGGANGNGTGATFNGPQGIGIDLDGNLYVADSANQKIRKIAPNGDVTTFAGTGTNGALDGVKSSATFNYPTSVVFDRYGNALVTEYGPHSIRKISASGVVSKFAGSSQGFANGTGTGAQFSFPQGVTLDSSGTAYVSDADNQRVRKITSATNLSGATLPSYGATAPRGIRPFGYGQWFGDHVGESGGYSGRDKFGSIVRDKWVCR